MSGKGSASTGSASKTPGISAPAVVDELFTEVEVLDFLTTEIRIHVSLPKQKLVKFYRTEVEWISGDLSQRQWGHILERWDRDI